MLAEEETEGDEQPQLQFQSPLNSDNEEGGTAQTIEEIASIIEM